MYGLNKMKQLIQREAYMLNQFRNALQATLDRLVNKAGSDQAVLEKLSEMLNDDNHFSWAMINKVELSLVDCYDDTSLQTEWQRQLAVVDYLPEKLASFYIQNANVTDTEKLRTLLTCLIKDVQWAREAKRVIRYTEQQMRKKVVALFLIGFALFFSPTIFRVLFGFEFDNLRLYYIFTAASSGILGAAFSQLTSIQSRVQSATLDQVRAMSQLGYIVARSMVGAGAGLIMFYLVQSGLLSGAFFPKFIHTVAELESFRSELTATGSLVLSNAQGVSQAIESMLSIGTLAQPAEGLSLLIVWCLLAGFSEKMIPGILDKKAKEAVSAKIGPSS